MTERPTDPEEDRPNRVGGLLAAITHRGKQQIRSPAWLTRVASVGLCVSATGFVITFAFVLESSGELALITNPTPMRLTFVLPYFVLLSTIGTIVGTGLVWWNHYWSLPARIHQTILAILGIGFTWQLFVLGFLG